MGIRVGRGIAIIFAVFAAVLLPWICEAESVILHTNDTHCGVAKGLGFSRVAAYKEDLAKEYPAVLLVDAGDAIQGEPIGSLSTGEAIVRIMNLTGYDFVIPGNHEFDFGTERFLALVPEQKCGYFSCNFIDKRTGKSVLPAYKIFTLDGRKVALIGVTTPDTLMFSTPRYFQDEQGKFIYSFSEDKDGTKLYAVVQKAVDEARAAGAETVLLVAHLGMNGTLPPWSSAAVAAHTTGVDAIIDGHSHEMYSYKVKNARGEDVILAQTGTKFQSVGKMILHDDGTITSELVKKIEREDPKVQALVDAELAVVEKTLAQPVGRAAVHLRTDIGGGHGVRSGETNIGDFAADAIRAVLHTDVAVVNGGAFRADIPVGEVTYKSLAATFPFNNMLAVKSLTGQQLLDVLEFGASAYPEENGGFMQVAGLSYTIDTHVPSSVERDDKGLFLRVAGKRRVKDVRVGGKPLDLTDDYTVGGIAYILRNGGDGMTMFDEAVLLRDTDISDIDALAAYVRDMGGIIDKGYENPAGDGRITILE